MQRTPHRCPHCFEPLAISHDMWGAYYLCEDCGWTAEDDEELAGVGAGARPNVLMASLIDSTDARRQPGSEVA